MSAAAVRHVNVPMAPGGSRAYALPRATKVVQLVGWLLIAASAVVITLGLTVTTEPPRPVAWTSVSVDHTGTLWEIAAAHGVEGLSTAQTVDIIREENGLSSSTLYVGQTLVVPGDPSDTLAVAQR